MGFKKHWPSLLALVLWAAPIWKFLVWLLDWRGRIDALAETYHEVGGATAIVGCILDPPPWSTPLGILAGLILIAWDLRRDQIRQNTARFNAQQVEVKTATEKEKHDTAAKWLESVLSDPAYCVNQAFLFGSIIHAHYPTSDVDLVLEFTALRDSKLASIVRKIKGKVARDFETTFQHKLHVTFFCSNEPRQRERFLKKAGGYQRIY